MKCPSCPVADPTPCASARHPRYCILAATRPDYLPTIVEASTGVRPEPPKGGGQAVPPLAHDFNAYRKIEVCDFRYSTCGCLSKPSVCRQFGYAGMVDLPICLACVSANSESVSS